AYQTAIELHLGLVSAYRYLAKAWEQLEQPANHVDSIYQTLSLSPETFTADEHCEMGQWLLEQCQEQEAMECFQRAVALEPDHQEAQQNLKPLLKKQKNGEFAEAATSEPGSSSVLQWPTQSIADREESVEALAILARSYRQMGNVDKAIAYYEDALDLDPRNIDLYQELGDLLIQAGLYQQALDLQYRLLQANGDQLSADYCTLLGDQFSAQQQPAKSIDCYRHAIQLDPQAILAHQKLIHVLKMEGQLRAVAKSYLTLAQVLNSQENARAAINVLEDGVDWLHQQFSSPQ
ncbi:MAG: tetratricopeptide repeat protein, partial [Symploca sp. SIO2B6]|nr:tetratricopeptide repeat protein [Symploca sp. SIO2B6]